MGNEVWCANKDLPLELRPTGDAMRGCPSYVTGDADDDAPTGVRVALKKIMARRSVR